MNGDYKSQFLSQLENFLKFNVGSVEDPRIVWEVIKGFIQSNAILFSSNLCKARSAKLQALEADFVRLDSTLQSNYSSQIAVEHVLVKK